MTENTNSNGTTAIITSIERHALHDGPGIRTLVFFKGCPLRCLWCSNPEGQQYQPELLFNRRLCTECGRCVTICPQKAISFTEDGITTDREQCNVCGQCVEICPTSARKITGKRMTVEDVMEVIMKDEVFYRHSGGGMTVSGGEPLSQAKFVQHLFAQCQQRILST